MIASKTKNITKFERSQISYIMTHANKAISIVTDNIEWFMALNIKGYPIKQIGI